MKYEYKFEYIIPIMCDEEHWISYYIEENDKELCSGYSDESFILKGWTYFPYFNNCAISHNQIYFKEISPVTLYLSEYLESYDKSDITFYIYSNEKLNENTLEKINKIFLKLLLKTIHNLDQNEKLWVLIIDDPFELLPPCDQMLNDNYINSYLIEYNGENLYFEIEYNREIDKEIDKSETTEEYRFVYRFDKTNYPILEYLPEFTYFYSIYRGEVSCKLDGIEVSPSDFVIPILLDDHVVFSNFDKSLPTEKTIPIQKQIKLCMLYFKDIIKKYIQAVEQEKIRAEHILKKCQNMRLDDFFSGIETW